MPRETKKRAPRRKAEQRAESMEQILDAAEFLFSRNGLYGVTLSDVAKRVGIHTTLVHYYFQDNQTLFEAVFARRAGVTSSRRMTALEEYEAEAGDSPTVEGALHAFLDTDLDLYYEGGEHWMNYGAFSARVSNTPEGAALMDVHFDPVVLKLVGILKRALPDYSASKGAIHAFTKTLAQELLPRGIRVNAVAPGPVWTPLNPSDAGLKADEVAQFGADSPMKRPAQPEELAPAYVYLASDADASYTTGIVLQVMGGETTGG